MDKDNVSTPRLHLLRSSRVRRLDREIAHGLQGLHAREARKGRRFLPNFVIIGAAKSATTTLTTVLGRHPDIFISRPKEPKFFGRHYDKGWKWYRSLFRPGGNFALRGEASTMYASSLREFEHTPALLKRYMPNTKIIYIARHPLDRIVSHWRHARGRRPSFTDFENILLHRHSSNLLIGCSLYYERISAYRRHFGDHQIHCMTFEEFVTSPSSALESLLDFLGTSANPEMRMGQGSLPSINKAGEKGRFLVPKPEWPKPMREKIIDMVRPDSEAFLSYIRKPSNYWDLQN